MRKRCEPMTKKNVLKNTARNLSAEGVSDEEILNICKEGIESGKPQISEDKTKFYIVIKHGDAQIIKSQTEPDPDVRIDGPFSTREEADSHMSQHAANKSPQTPWVANTYPKKAKRLTKV